MLLRRYLLATLAVLALAPATATAGGGGSESGGGGTSLAALVDERTLLTIDVANRRVTRRVTVQGVGRLLSIDLRTSDQRLYGLDVNGKVVTINPANGQTMAKPTLQATLPAGTRVNIDFNPVVDRLRIVAEDGTNLRANVDDGTVTADMPLNFAPPRTGTPNVLAAAYTNNFAGTTDTLLYDITALDLLFLQLPPNNGTLNGVGPLGINVTQFGFDIQTRDRRNRGLLVSGTSLYDIDLAGGRVFNKVAIRNLNGDIVRDIAVLRQGS